jgi:hypothetical protein
MNAVSIRHPSAPRADAGASRTPRYLIRPDGVVLHYHPALARLPGLMPSDELPEWHLRRIGVESRDAAALSPGPSPACGRGESDELVAAELSRLGQAKIGDLRRYLRARQVRFDPKLEAEALRELAFAAARSGGRG